MAFLEVNDIKKSFGKNEILKGKRVRCFPLSAHPAQAKQRFFVA